MDANRLDELCSSLTHTPVSRRTSLKLFAATALAGVGGLTRADPASAAAHCRRVGTRCRQTSECCGSDIGIAVCSPSSGLCACVSDPTVHLCSKTRQCVGCPEFDMGFNSATCACTCAAGASSCGSGDHCCFGDTCSGGTCVGSCAGGGGTCDSGFSTCGTTSNNCFSFSTAEGTCVCGQGALCVDLQACTSSAQCPSGTACTVNTCCGGGGVCTTLCTGSTTAGTPAAALAGRAANFRR
jgi:hypothetical protein